MIKVGINENVVLQDVELVEKDGKYSVDFTLVDAASLETDNKADEEYDENGMLVTGSGGGRRIKVWPLTPPDDTGRDNQPKTIKAKCDEINDTIKQHQNLYMSFAKCFLPLSQIKFDRFAGIPVTQENQSVLLGEEVLLTVSKNLANQFIEMCKPYFNDPTFKLRIKLRRQSKDKHYPTFPTNLLHIFPFVERMEVQPSKLAFTKYEIEHGYDNGDPVTAVDETQETAPADPSTLFGQAPQDLSSVPGLN